MQDLHPTIIMTSKVVTPAEQVQREDTFTHANMAKTWCINLRYQYCSYYVHAHNLGAADLIV